MVQSLKIGDKCPKCRSPVTRGSKMFFWRGEYQDGAFCMACNALWPIEGEEIPPLKQESLIRQRLRGWQNPVLDKEVQVTLAGDRFDECPLKAAGYTLVSFTELPSMVIGPDGKCICTKAKGCINCDKRDGMRCTLEQLKQLDSEAISRRARQSGWYDD